MEWIVFGGLVVITILVVIISTIISKNNKTKDFLQSYFGKIPTDFNEEIESIETYYLLKNKQLHNNEGIDDITWNDLDMYSVFDRINVCLTSIGEEYLYDTLHRPKFEKEPLEKREKLITYLKEHPKERYKIQLNLLKCGKSNYNGLCRLIFDSKSQIIGNPPLLKALRFSPVFSALLIFLNVSTAIMLIILTSIMNIVLYYSLKKTLESRISGVEYFLNALISCDNILKVKDEEFSELCKDLKNELATFKSLRRTKFIRPQSSFSEASIINEYINAIFLNNLITYNKAISIINKNTDSFHNFYKLFGELDMAMCILSFRQSLGYYCTPEFTNDNKIEFTDIFHPLLSHPISNSGEIKNNSIVTGSNASGKSTFIKALAVNGILSQTIFTCTANEFKTRFSLVISSMAVRDNITAGDSYFITEIKSLKRIIEKVELIPCVCYIDEILKGTNTIERIAASASVLNFLNYKNCLCIVASHDIELTNILKDKYDNFNFCEQVTDDEILFDYKLKYGPSQTRNAIKLLDYLQFDSEIVTDAQTRVEKFVDTQTW